MASRSGERRTNMMRTARAARPDLVSEALRQLWSNAENDPVPDDFLALLDRLDAARATPPQPDADPTAAEQQKRPDDREAPAA